MNYYSYVMGISNKINSLKDKGFLIEKANDDYMVTFPEENITIWEDFIREELKEGFWNEFIGKNIIFIFKFKNKEVKKYILTNENEKEILNLCCEFSNCKFKSIESMLKDNVFYNKNYFKKRENDK